MSFLGGKLEWLKTRLSRHRKGVIVAVVLLAIFTSFGLVFARDSSAFAFVGPQAVLNVANILARMINWVAIGVAHFIVALIGVIIVPVLGYNSFGSSPIVGIGWSLVRDVVNMFVIVVLLVIAIQTILGLSRANIQQQLPRIVIAVIAVNFSKTISLLLIDMGQVVMFTFVNSIRDIAAGNFVNLFQMTAYFDINRNVAYAEQGMEAAGYLGSAYLSLSLMLAVLATLLIMALVFIYRIVVLWVLIIISPLAFFMGGIRDVVGPAGGVYGDWWSKMTGAITLGPILAFFLWLALAASSAGGSIATAQNFPQPEDPQTTGLYTKIFELEKLTSLFIGLVLIFVGFQAASGAAGNLGGVASQFVNEGMGNKIFRGALTLPAKTGYQGGRRLATYGVREAERRTGAFSGIGNELARQGGSLRAKGGLASLAGGALLAGGGAITQKTDFASEDRKKSKERINSYSDAQKFAELHAITDPSQRTRISMRDDQAELLAQFATNKAIQKGYMADLENRYGKGDAKVEEEYKKRMEAALKYVDKNKDDLLDDGQKQALFKTKAQNLHLLDEEEIAKVVNDDDFKVTMLSTDAASDAKVQKALSEKTWSEQRPDGTTKTVSLLEQARSGKGVSVALRDALRGLPQPKKIKLDDQDAVDRVTVDELTAALRAGRNKPSEIDATHVSGVNAPKFAQAVADAGVRPDQLDTNVRAQVLTEMQGMRNQPTTQSPTKVQIDRFTFESTRNPAQAFNMTPAGEISDRDSRVAFTRVIEDDVANARAVRAQAQDARTTGVSNDVTRGIVDAVRKERLVNMRTEHEDPRTTDARRQEIREGLAAIADAIEAEVTTVTRGGAIPSPALLDLQGTARMVQRYVR